VEVNLVNLGHYSLDSIGVCVEGVFLCWPLTYSFLVPISLYGSKLVFP